VEGGGKVACTTTMSQVKTDITDNGNGSYKIVWNASVTGTFETSVTIDGKHVGGSPTDIRFISHTPDLSKTVSKGDGLVQTVKNELASFKVVLHDEYGNPTAASADVHGAFRLGIALLTPDEPQTDLVKKNKQSDFDGEWVATDEQYAYYQVRYKPATSGAYSLHLWVEGGPLTPNGERCYLPGSPFNVQVRANANDQVTHEVVDVSGIESGDYKVDKAMYEELQRKWGAFSIDAFASVATAMAPRFWAASRKAVKKDGAEAVDAFQQRWQSGERIWAHPPTAHLDELAKLLARGDRGAEVVVCAPYRPTSDWYYRINKMSDEQVKYRSGKLLQVADDAPKRVNEWPLIIFHIPPPATHPPQPTRNPHPLVPAIPAA